MAEINQFPFFDNAVVNCGLNSRDFAVSLGRKRQVLLENERTRRQTMNIRKTALKITLFFAAVIVVYSLLKPAEKEATITAVDESRAIVWENTITNNAVKITTNRATVDVVAVTPTNNTNLVVVETLAVTPTNNVPEGYKRIKVSLVGDFAVKPQQTKPISTNQ